MAQPSPLLAFRNLIKVSVPLLRPGWRVLKVGSGLAAELYHALRFSTLGFSRPDPLKLPEEFFRLGPPIVLIRLKSHFHRRLAVAGPVLDLRRVGD